MMTVYKVDRIHKIEVSAVKAKNFPYRVKFFERMGGRWVQLGEEETWATLEDIKLYYGIE